MTSHVTRRTGHDGTLVVEARLTERDQERLSREQLALFFEGADTLARALALEEVVDSPRRETLRGEVPRFLFWLGMAILTGATVGATVQSIWVGLGVAGAYLVVSAFCLLPEETP